MKLDGATVLLTGATGGIGHAIARTLGGKGAKLILTGRRAEVLEPLASELGAQALAVDLSDPAELDRLVAESGAVDILVANAALPAAGRLESFTMEEVDRALDVNLRAPIALAHALAPPMVQRGLGHIVFISSLSGKAATPGSALYNATKFGLRGFTLALRADLHNSGVGVSGVYPGFIRDAGMFADAGVDIPKPLGTRTPEDVARAVVRAIERDRAGVDVGSLTLRAGILFSEVAPELAAKAARKMGSDELSHAIGAGQRDKR